MSAKGQIKKGVNIIEGEVPLRDYGDTKDGKPIFETWDFDEWKEYALKKKLVNINGQKPCAICNTVVYYKEMAAYEKPLCENCLAKVSKYSEHVKINKDVVPDDDGAELLSESKEGDFE